MDVDGGGLELLPELVSPGPEVIARDVDRDAGEPGIQTTVTAEALPAAEGTQKGILGNGFRQIGIPRGARDKPADSRLVQPDQLIYVIELADDSGPLRPW